MNRRLAFHGTLLAITTLFAAACEQAPTAPVDLSPDFSMAAQQQPRSGEGVDQHALGQQIPAFGGFYLEHGAPVVLLTDPSQRGAASQALSSFLQHRGFAPAGLRIRQARFTYRQLEGFFSRARAAVFDGPGGVFADLDEANNRVTLGVENGTAAGRVRAAVARLGLPEGAVEVVETEPILPVQSLQDPFNPVPAGVQIHFTNYLCSIGVIAKSGEQLGFVTASHCTATQGGVEGTQYYQPLSSLEGTVIAIETIDPVYVSWKEDRNCYRGTKCRYSDASFAAATGARPFALGQIAQTTALGSLTWNGSYWTVTGAADGNGNVGDSRAKVGRTTGYTTGTVTGSCVDTGVSGSNIVLLCQDWVEGDGVIVGGGDSGSDVFRVSSGSEVIWWGGLWGGSSDGSTFIYSPATNIQRELGTLAVTGGGGGEEPTLTASFTHSCKFGDCSFDASGSTGAIDRYDWAFSEGGSATGMTTTHSYTDAGIYSVTLTVTDTGGATDAETSTIQCTPRGSKLQCK